MINLGMIGYGYWGPNLLRTFSQIPDAQVAVCCDSDQKALKRVTKVYPEIRTETDYKKVLANPGIDAVIIAVPVPLHAEFAIKALRAGKHVFVEKPLALKVSEARRVVDVVEASGKVLMVGHLLMYHPAVDRLKSIIESGELGDVYYAYCQRLNLGIIRSNENALWSLAPHDVSVIMYLFGETPVSVSAVGEDYLQKGIEDTVFVHLKFRKQKMAHIHVSWLDPHRVRRLTIVGDKKMAVFDDVESSEKVRIYDKGVATKDQHMSYGESLQVRFGDIYIPKIESVEPLRTECLHFLAAVRDGARPRSDHRNGMEVVRVLDAAQRSLRRGGREVRIND